MSKSSIKKFLIKEIKNRREFIDIYLQDLKVLKKLTTTEYIVLNNMTYFIDYSTNEFFLNKSRREELAKKSDVAYNTINQIVSNLLKKNILFKITSGLYKINSNLLFTEQELTESKKFELIITYKII